MATTGDELGRQIGRHVDAAIMSSYESAGTASPQAVFEHQAADGHVWYCPSCGVVNDLPRVYCESCDTKAKGRMRYIIIGQEDEEGGTNAYIVGK